ncbi:Guanylate kinase [Streptomyces purpurascens]
MAATSRGTSPVPPDVRPRLVPVLSGPSGVGKSTVVAHMRKEHPEVWLSVSATTRKPRPGEKHGVHYFFVTDDEMDKLIANGELLEWAEFAGNRYGTPRAAVQERLEAGEPVLLEIDLQGARLVRESMPEAQLVFLAPPSWEELVRRLTGRGYRTARGDRAPARGCEDRTRRRAGVRHHPGQHLRRGRGSRAASLDERGVTIADRSDPR